MAKRIVADPEQNKPTPEENTPVPLVARAKAQVFISHDNRDADLAEAFGNLLTDASGGILKSFRSSDKRGTAGIEFGAEWYDTIMRRLKDATDVVALLTQSSVDRPWILYEAGVAKGKLDTVVFGVAIGIPLEKVGTGPFAQFQNCSDDEDSLTKLVLQLIKRNPDAAPREEAVRRQVGAFRQNIAALIKDAKKGTTMKPVDENAVAKLFEEVKVMFRELPEKVEDKMRDTVRRGSARRRPRFHPGMIEELMFHPRMQEIPGGSASGLLLLVSTLKDDVPWLYEVGVDLYRAICSKNQQEIATARARFMAMAELFSHGGPFLEEMMGVDDRDRETYRYLRHLPEMVDSIIQRSMETKEPKPRRTKSVEHQPPSHD